MATVIVYLDVDDGDASDPQDLALSIGARLEGEAGYLDDGKPIIPNKITTLVYVDEHVDLIALDNFGFIERASAMWKGDDL